MAARARLRFLIPPGNPTVEPEMIEMAPAGVSVHFSRMVAHGPTGTLEGQEERNRTQIKHIGESAALLAMVKPNVIMLAHTATSYTLGRHAEAELVQRLQNECGTAVGKTPERALQLGRAVDTQAAQAFFSAASACPPSRSSRPLSR